MESNTCIWSFSNDVIRYNEKSFEVVLAFLAIILSLDNTHDLRKLVNYMSPHIISRLDWHKSKFKTLEKEEVV